MNTYNLNYRKNKMLYNIEKNLVKLYAKGN